MSSDSSAALSLKPEARSEPPDASNALCASESVVMTLFFFSTPASAKPCCQRFGADVRDPIPAQIHEIHLGVEFQQVSQPLYVAVLQLCLAQRKPVAAHGDDLQELRVTDTARVPVPKIDKAAHDLCHHRAQRERERSEALKPHKTVRGSPHRQ